MDKIMRIEGKTLTNIKGTTNLLIVPEKVEIIARHTFRDYQGEVIVLPNNIRVIGPNTFKNCTSTIYYDQKDLPGIHKEAFNGFLGTLKPRDEYLSRKKTWYQRLFKK